MPGLGSIKAVNRTLDDVRTEVRNILIRNGLAPNFQLEITNFLSKKSYVNVKNGASKIVPLSNIPVSIKEIALGSGLTGSSKSRSLITLTRNGKTFRITAGQLFDLNAPEVWIIDKDQIEIDIAPSVSSQTVASVGSRGNILLPGLGSIKAVNRTLDDVRTEVRNILIRNGLAPNFQLEITNFLSKKSYVNVKNGASKIVPLSNIPVSIKEIALGSGLTGSSKSRSLITLTRNGKTFRITAGQLFDLNAPEVWIIDKDQIEIDIAPSVSSQTVASVGSRGNILLPGLGSIKAVNRTLDDVQNEVHKLLIKKGLLPSFQLELTGFKSKKVYFIEKKNGSITVPLGNTKITLKELIINSRQEVTSADGLIVITLTRNEEVFRMTWDQIFDPGAPDIWIRDQDQVELESLSYKPGQVFALSGAGNAKMVPIDPSNRETLADILFTEDGALSNVLAKRSEVYLLRGRNPSVAYHLDAQNVSRILVAAKTELRPDDIVFVADRPIVSFARALGELSPLQMLLRDIRTDNLP